MYLGGTSSSSILKKVKILSILFCYLSQVVQSSCFYELLLTFDKSFSPGVLKRWARDRESRWDVGGGTNFRTSEVFSRRKINKSHFRTAFVGV